jgi:hypothetical protein
MPLIRASASSSPPTTRDDQDDEHMVRARKQSSVLLHEGMVCAGVKGLGARSHALARPSRVAHPSPSPSVVRQLVARGVHFVYVACPLLSRASS